MQIHYLQIAEGFSFTDPYVSWILYMLQTIMCLCVCLSVICLDYLVCTGFKNNVTLEGIKTP